MTRDAPDELIYNIFGRGQGEWVQIQNISLPSVKDVFIVGSTIAVSGDQVYLYAYDFDRGRVSLCWSHWGTTSLHLTSAKIILFTQRDQKALKSSPTIHHRQHANQTYSLQQQLYHAEDSYLGKFLALGEDMLIIG